VQDSTVGFGHLPVGAVSGTIVALPFAVGFSSTLGSVQALTLGTTGLDFTVVAAGTTCVAGTTDVMSCNVNVQFLPTAGGLRRGSLQLFNNASPNAPIISVPIYGFGDAPLATLSPNTASVISTGGVATDTPFQVALDGAGNMYVADYEGGNVLKVPPGGGSASVVSTGGITLGNPAGVALDGAGNLFITDHFNDRIVEVTAGGVSSVLGITGLSEGLVIPTGLAVDAAGNLYISDYGTGRVIKVTPAGAGSVVGTGSFTPGGDSVLGVAVDAAGTVYFPDSVNNRVIKVTAAGAASLVVPAGLTPVLSSPEGVAVDGFGNLYIGDAGNGRIMEVTSAGTAFVVPTPGLPSPSGLGAAFYAIAADPSGNVLIPDFGYNRIVKANVSGASLAFPNTYVGSDSSPLTATITNIGDLPLVFATNPTYTVNFSENSGNTNLCTSSTSLAAGTVCDVSVEFTPQSVGPLSASIVVTNNNLNASSATQSVAASGTGLSAGDTTAVTVSTNPTSIILGQALTIAATVTDTATGNTGIVPTGGVTFMDQVGATVISLNGGNPVTLNGAGKAILTGVTLSGAGLHTITANYAGVADTFLASSNTTTIMVTAASASTTTLTIAPGSSVAAGTLATLTATVVSNSVPVTEGRVIFCDATATYCDGSAVFGSAQLTSAGAAAIKLTLGVGVYSIAAAFQPTSSALASTSAAQPFTVTANASYLSFSAIAASGSAGNYTLTGTVTAFGTTVPTGTVSFLDTSNGNAAVAMAALAPSTRAFGFISAAGSPLAEPNDGANAVSGDFNNDGIPDVAVVDYNTPTVTIFLGKGDGAFQPAVSYSLQTYGYGLAVGDFNGDGKLDLAVASSGSVSVLLGNGDGTFQAETAYAVGTTNVNIATGLVVGDFNSDGILDIVAVNSINSDSASTVSILLGNGDGTFQPQVQYAAGTQPYWVTAGDFNGDGKLDLAVSSQGSQSSVNILLGNGDGSFQSPVAYAIGAGSDYILAADLNKDGKIDLVTANLNNTVSVFLGNGDGTFQAPVAYTTGSEPADIAVGDFNADGNLDLAVTNYGDNTVSILSGNGDGTFQPRATSNTGNSPWGIVAGDFNGDGLTDLFVVNNGDNTDSVLLDEQNETATATAVSVAGAGTHNVLASYPGDPSRAASQSTTMPLTGVGLTVTATTLIAAPNPAIAGQSVTLTATVAPAPTGSTLGSVSFYNGLTLLGTITVNSSGIAAFTTGSLPAGVLSLTAVYSGNAGFAGSTSTAVSETVTPGIITTITTLTASPDPLADGQPATLTATVSPAPTGTPAGTVSFYSGTTLLGTETLNASGVATLTLSSLVVGADSITAVYSGNAGYAASTSSAVNETVTTSYTVTGPTTPVPVAPGGSVNIDITVPPLGGTFENVVTLSASGLPAGATVTFNPPTVTPGSAGAPTVMTIQLPTVTASIPARDIPSRHKGLPVATFSLAFVLFGAGLGRKRIPRALALVVGLGATASLLTSRGGGFANTPETKAGNYTITVTGTSGSIQVSTTVTLVVE
jgi:sugar lactone lactonase YvrE